MSRTIVDVENRVENASFNKSKPTKDTHRDAKSEQNIISLPEEPQHDRWVFYVLPVIAIISMTFTAYYYKCCFSLLTPSTGNYAFLIINIILRVPSFAGQLWSLLTFGLLKRQTRLRINGASVPSVDVFVTACNEDMDMILNTVRAACLADYPQDRFRVVVLDDANDRELRTRVEMMPFKNVLYHASTEKLHAKVGNMNAGLKLASAANFVAFLDVDMIPNKSWLRALLPPLLLDPNCAITCLPQSFYNVLPEDSLGQTLERPWHFYEAVRGAMGDAQCTGSGFVLRREALQDIGGVLPTAAITDDFLLSCTLQGAGWKIVGSSEPLQHGTVPSGLTSHIKQRIRWAIGTIEVAVALKFFLSPKTKHMTPFQRFVCMTHTILALWTIPYTIAMMLSPVLLSKANLHTPNMTLFTTACINDLLIFFCARLTSTQTSTGYKQADFPTILAPTQALAIIRHFLLPKAFGHNLTTYIPTGAIAPKSATTSTARFRNMLIDDCVIWHVSILVLLIASIAQNGLNVAHVWPPLWWYGLFRQVIDLWQLAKHPLPERKMKDILDVDGQGVYRPNDDNASESTWSLRREALSLASVVAMYAIPGWLL